VGCHQTGRGIDPENGLGILHGQHARFQDNGGNTDDPMPAHTTVAFVVQEQHAKVSLF